MNFLSQEEASVFSSWMNKALDFVCGRIPWPCELPDYSRQISKEKEPLTQAEPRPPQPPYHKHPEDQPDSRIKFKVSNEPKNPVAPLNNNLLAEIRGGASLRPINGNLPVNKTGNFNDELKRRLAGRQINSPIIQSPLPTGVRVDSSDYSSEPSPDTVDKTVVGSEEIRNVIRTELKSFRTELIDAVFFIVRTHFCTTN